MFPEQIRKFIDAFSDLPAIGPRMATRLAFYVLSGGPADRAALESALAGLGTLTRCSQCFFWGESERCAICADPLRNQRTIAIVEKETDLLSLEKAGAWKGVYLVIGELSPTAPLTAEQKTRLASLKGRIAKDLGGSVEEIVIALGPSTAGDFTAAVVAQGFKGMAKRITRLARGIPTGGEVEFADEETLRQALDGRR